jgi:hypothetical protein
VGSYRGKAPANGDVRRYKLYNIDAVLSLVVALVLLSIRSFAPAKGGARLIRHCLRPEGVILGLNTEISISNLLDRLHRMVLGAFLFTGYHDIISRRQKIMHLPTITTVSQYLASLLSPNRRTVQAQ